MFGRHPASNPQLGVPASSPPIHVLVPLLPGANANMLRITDHALVLLPTKKSQGKKKQETTHFPLPYDRDDRAISTIPQSPGPKDWNSATSSLSTLSPSTPSRYSTSPGLLLSSSSITLRPL